RADRPARPAPLAGRPGRRPDAPDYRPRPAPAPGSAGPGTVRGGLQSAGPRAGRVRRVRPGRVLRGAGFRLMKVLLVTEVFPPQVGGSGRWLWEVYRRLPREGYVLAAGQHPAQESFDRTHDLRLERVPLTFSTWGVASPAGLRQYARAAWRLWRLARAERVGALHCGKCLPEGLLAWMLKRVAGLPYLCYVHGEELNLAGGSRELTWLTRRVLRGSALVIANSRNTEGLLRDGWGLPPERVRVLHPGADTQRFVPAPADAECRARLGWAGRTVVLTVG